MAASINVVKFVNGEDADSPTGPHVAAGSTVTFTYVVTNTGNDPLASVVVTDDELGTITSFSGDANGNGRLDLTETWTYTKTATALAGQQTNTGTVTANDANTPGTLVTDNNPANYFGDAPAINIVKFVNGQDADGLTGPHVAAGSTLTFTYVVTNTGNDPLANVVVTDDKLGPITSFTGDTNGNGLLDLTETWIYTTTATALAGQQTNTGTVTGRDANSPPGTLVTDNNPANYFGDAPAISIVKFVNGQDADTPTGPHVAAGSTLTFTYVVFNTGNAALANVVVTYDKLGPITSFTGDTNANGLLDLTETWTYTKTATALAGQQTNIGSVTGQDANTAATVTDDNPANYFGGPAVNIVKFVNGQDADTPTGPHVAAGSTLTFTYVVTNTGNDSLANVVVTDDKLGPITSFTGDTNSNGLLDLTETWTYTTTATALAGQQTNVGSVTANDANNPPGTAVADDNPANYFGDTPAIVGGAAIFGTGGKDLINAQHSAPGQPLPTAFADAIYGRGGADTIYGLGGNDWISGGLGSDMLLGGAGNDVLFGGPGDDQLFGGLGADRLNGGIGSNRLTGGPGADQFFLAVLGGNITRVVDFTPGVDKLVLAKSVFTSVDHVSYVAATGALLFDPDGAGHINPFQFGSLAAHLHVTDSDFLFL